MIASGLLFGLAVMGIAFPLWFFLAALASQHAWFPQLTWRQRDRVVIGLAIILAIAAAYIWREDISY